MAKNKQPPRGPRNHLAVAVRNPQGPFRQKAAKSDAERAEQRDRFSRHAKYKASPEDFDMEDENLDEGFQVGDEVRHKGKTGMVKNPKAPLGMVGLTIDGQYALVPEDQIELIEESLRRMRELSK